MVELCLSEDAQDEVEQPEKSDITEALQPEMIQIDVVGLYIFVYSFFLTNFCIGDQELVV